MPSGRPLNPRLGVSLGREGLAGNERAAGPTQEHEEHAKGCDWDLIHAN